MKAWLSFAIYLFRLGGISDMSREIIGAEPQISATLRPDHVTPPFGQNAWLLIATSDHSR